MTAGVWPIHRRLQILNCMGYIVVVVVFVVTLSVNSVKTHPLRYTCKLFGLCNYG